MNAHLATKQKKALEAKYAKRLRGLLKPELFDFLTGNDWFLPGKRDRCAMSRQHLIMVIAQTTWCTKWSKTVEVPIPRNVRSAELWQELQRLINKKYPGTAWPETVKARGITKAELI